MKIPFDIINEIKSFLIKCSNCCILNIPDELNYCGRCENEQNRPPLLCKNCLYESYYYYNKQCCYDCYDYDSEDSIGYDIVDWLTF